MPKIHYRQAQFLKSAATLQQLPPDTGMEVAFMGCSNAGKSTTLNAVTDNKQLARTSKTPGRTQLINLFTIDDSRRLVDLPGYGYAKVPQAVKDAWQEQLNAYLLHRQCLRGIVLVSDIRHPLKPFEQEMIDWALESQIPLLLLLNKADKLSKQAQQQALNAVSNQIPGQGALVQVQLFSALEKIGLDEIYAVLDDWFEFSSGSR